MTMTTTTLRTSIVALALHLVLSTAASSAALAGGPCGNPTGDPGPRGLEIAGYTTPLGSPWSFSAWTTNDRTSALHHLVFWVEAVPHGTSPGAANVLPPNGYEVWNGTAWVGSGSAQPSSGLWIRFPSDANFTLAPAATVSLPLSIQPTAVGQVLIGFDVFADEMPGPGCGTSSAVFSSAVTITLN